jgi:hypothetical protein
MVVEAEQITLELISDSANETLKEFESARMHIFQHEYVIFM